MTVEFQYDIFLSHSAKDKAVVRPLAERLRQDGLKVWLDEWMLKPGDSIPAKIEEGLEHSRVLVLCMSANAFGSDWAQLESGTFRFRDPLNKERRFLPLRLDDAPIKASLAQFLYINWQEAVREREYDNFFNACRNGVKCPCDGSLQVEALRTALEFMKDQGFNKHEVVNGTWVGTLYQFHCQKEEEPIPVPLRVELRFEAELIRGMATYRRGRESEVALDLEGRFHTDELVRLEFRNKDKRTKHLGTFMAKLSQTGTKVEGCYAGFGLEFDQPVHGVIFLTKETDSERDESSL